MGCSAAGSGSLPNPTFNLLCALKNGVMTVLLFRSSIAAISLPLNPSITCSKRGFLYSLSSRLIALCNNSRSILKSGSFSSRSAMAWPSISTSSGWYLCYSLAFSRLRIVNIEASAALPFCRLSKDRHARKIFAELILQPATCFWIVKGHSEKRLGTKHQLKIHKVVFRCFRKGPVYLSFFSKLLQWGRFLWLSALFSLYIYTFKRLKAWGCSQIAMTLQVFTGAKSLNRRTLRMIMSC